MTINAIARADNGQLVDPFNGLKDLEGRWLRHVSPAFAEDPVRILRVARFCARYSRLSFRVAPETLTLMQTMVANGEVDALVAERVWAETQKALNEPSPERFIEVLRECGALARIFPEIDHLFGVPQPEQHHPEIDTGVHLLMCLQQAVSLNADLPVRFAVLVHDLGKGTTPPDEWPRHLGHEERGAELVRTFCQRLRVPNAYRELGMVVAAYHTRCHGALTMRPGSLLRTLEYLDALRKPERFEQFLLACEIDARGRKGLEDQPYPQADHLRQALTAAANIAIQPLIQRGLKSRELQLAIRQKRAQAIASTTGRHP